VTDSRSDMFDGLTEAQRSALLNLLGRMGGSNVKVRVVEEFDGQINAPVALEVPDGARFLISADGTVTEYPREVE
jgi:hypothetical protein